MDGPNELSPLQIPYSAYSSGFPSGSIVVSPPGSANQTLILQGLDVYLPSGSSGAQFVTFAFINTAGTFWVVNSTSTQFQSAQWRGALPLGGTDFIYCDYSYPAGVGVLSWGYRVMQPIAGATIN